MCSDTLPASNSTTKRLPTPAIWARSSCVAPWLFRVAATNSPISRTVFMINATDCTAYSTQCQTKSSRWGTQIAAMRFAKANVLEWEHDRHLAPFGSLHTQLLLDVLAADDSDFAGANFPKQLRAGLRLESGGIDDVGRRSIRGVPVPAHDGHGLVALRENGRID